MSVAAIVLCVVAVVLGFLVIRMVVSALWNYIMILLGIAIAIFCLGHRMGILGCSTAEMKMSLGC